MPLPEAVSPDNADVAGFEFAHTLACRLLLPARRAQRSLHYFHDDIFVSLKQCELPSNSCQLGM
jgi:hypothetical protein